MSIPLVQNNEKDSINTSIIAIKRNIERINMLLGLSNSEEIDTSEFVKKSDIVDEVTVGNMQSLTSNAVAKCLSYSTTEQKTGFVDTDGKDIYKKTYIFKNQSVVGSTNVLLGQISGFDVFNLRKVETVVFGLHNNTNKVYLGNMYSDIYITNNNLYIKQIYTGGTMKLDIYATFIYVK